MRAAYMPQPDNLLVNPRSGVMKLSGFGRAGVWDPVAEDASEFSYAPSKAPLKHGAPEVSGATFGERATSERVHVWSGLRDKKLRRCPCLVEGAKLSEIVTI